MGKHNVQELFLFCPSTVSVGSQMEEFPLSFEDLVSFEEPLKPFVIDTCVWFEVL